MSRTPPAHRATTAHLQAAYPFVEVHRPLQGPLLGLDNLGQAFCFDPWDRYAAGELTGPNLVVLGQIGRGKSTFVKTFVWREVAFGRRAWIIDPKGEYGPLAAACGTRPIRLRPGGGTRLNPLDPVGVPAGAGPGDLPGGLPGDLPGGLAGGLPDRHGPRPASNPAEAARRGSELLASISASSLGRPLLPAERSALDLAVRASGPQPTLPLVVDALLEPHLSSAAEVRTDVAGLAADGRQVALELRRLVGGDLGGMFDGPTSVGVELDAPVVVLDLSALYRSAALGIVMICATAWLHAAMTAGDGRKRVVVVDEAWAVLQDLATARWLRSSFKLARSLGAAHVAVLHRLSDLRAAGPEGSEQRQLAEGLLADAETRVVFAQPPSESGEAAALLGLSSTEEELLGHLPRGAALWKVGDRSTVVRHRVGPAEAGIVDTDGAMRETS